MSHILIIGGDAGTVGCLEAILQKVGHEVASTPSGTAGCATLDRWPSDVAFIESRLPDGSGLQVLRLLRRRSVHMACILVATPDEVRDAVRAIHDGAFDVLEKPLTEGAVLQTVGGALAACAAARGAGGLEAHAAVRWARAVVPLVESTTDPRTIADWATWVAASPGAIRNWCRTASITPRRSLTFARMLRAVLLSADGPWLPAQWLDVVDRRNLVSLMRYAGFADEHDVPRTVAAFLAQQQLIRDGDAIAEIIRALADRGPADARHPLPAMAGTRRRIIKPAQPASRHTAGRGHLPRHLA